MAFDYSNLANVALFQISDKGRNVTLRYVEEGTYNPGTDAFSGTTFTDTTVKALIRNYSLRELLDTIILVGDKEVILASSGITRPEVNDIIIDSSSYYRILNVVEIIPGDTSLLYKLQVRLSTIDMDDNPIEVLRINEAGVLRVTEAEINRILEN